jgi:hypothetical protein
MSLSDVLTLLLTAAVAGATLLLSANQFRLEKQRARHEVYERRMQIYRAISSFLGIIAINHAILEAAIAVEAIEAEEEVFGDIVIDPTSLTDEVWNDFLVYTDEARFLLKEIYPYIRQLRETAEMVYFEYHEARIPLEIRQKLNLDPLKIHRKFLEVHKWLAEQSEIVGEHFAPYLDTDL